MSISVGDVLQIVAIMAWVDGQIQQNVFNATVGGTGGPYDDDDVVDDLHAWVDDIFTELDTSQSQHLNGADVRVYIYDSIDDDWDEVGAKVWGHSPNVTADELPRGVAALINAKTTDPDVSGKKYFGGMTEASVTDGLWTAGELARLVLAGVEWTTAFTGAFSGASWIPGVWSVKNTNFYAFSGTEIIPTIPAYQRRRKQGVGI